MNLTLHATDFNALSPFLTLLVGALLLLFLEGFFDTFAKKWASWLALITLLVASVAAFYAPVSGNQLLTPWVQFDPLAHFFTMLFLAIGAAVVLLSIAFFNRYPASKGEYYFFILGAVAGLILIGIAADFLTLFLGLEILSISLYILCGYMKRWEKASESAVKYFLIGSIAAAALLYGIALIYGAIGSTHFVDLLTGYQSLSKPADQLLFFVGIALVTIGLAFKAAVVPFHTWAPDVYDGASSPVTALMAVGTKIGAFAAFVRVFMYGLAQFDPIWNQMIVLLACLTLIYANIVAIRQAQFRRFFAYSGISHAGFLLIPLAVGSMEALSSLLFYAVIYAIATMGAFTILTVLDPNRDGLLFKDLPGLFRRQPLRAALLALCLLTLAGIPPTVGFFAKFYLFKVAIGAGYYALVTIALLSTILAAYYYLRIIAVMFSDDERMEPLPSQRSASTFIVAVVACAALLFLSSYPEPLMQWIKQGLR